MTSPSPGPARLEYPTRTKVVVVVVLTVAIAALVLAYLTTAEGDGGDAQVTGAPGLGERDPDGVDALIPPRGSQILGQEQIGIDLAPGWTGELLLLPGNGRASTLPDGQLETDELNRITFTPGEGKAIERLSGDYCIAATIWDRVEGREATQRTENWCFSAT